MTGEKEDRPDAAVVPGETHWPHYYSTSCIHGLHDRCLGECKFCPAKCRCRCHRENS